MDRKRIFYGLEVKAPWPEILPSGRLLLEADRHMTLAFLGDVDYEHAAPLLSAIPSTSRKVGFSGRFSQCLFLPPRRPSCVSWHVDWITGGKELLRYQKQLESSLVDCALLSAQKIRKDFLPHVTICRGPFSINRWKKAFSPLPMIASSLHLYESLGHLRYKPTISFPLLPPFEELDHTADIAFNIYGESIQEIYLHACIALAFEHPPILSYIDLLCSPSSIDEIVAALNELILKIDSSEGAPFKAVSFHGSMEKLNEHVLKWEMIVDV